MMASAAALPPSQLIVGSPQHGVVRYATRIADAIARIDAAAHVDVINAPSLDELWMRAEAGSDQALPHRAHLHVTDRLLGANALDAADRFERLAAQVSLSITLHDVPQPSDGAGFERRVEGYRRMIASARAITCNSRHEVALIDEHLGIDTSGIAVMPLPVAGVSAHPARPTPTNGIQPEIAVLGFIYPGKGHADVIHAVGAIPRAERPRVVALGTASPGHEPDVDELRALADALAVDFEVTGFLSDAEQLERCRSAAVPVVALHHVSASGSIATWIEAGRRPLVPESRYALEIAELRPGSVSLYALDRLDHELHSALGDDRSTWLAADVDTRPHPEDIAAAYLSWWREVRW